MQAYLIALAEGETPPAMGSEPPNLATFIASLSSAWRNARERGVSVGTKTYRVFNDKWSGRKRDIFADHWTEMGECLEEQPQ